MRALELGERARRARAEKPLRVRVKTWSRTTRTDAPAGPRAGAAAPSASAVHARCCSTAGRVVGGGHAIGERGRREHDEHALPPLRRRLGRSPKTPCQARAAVRASESPAPSTALARTSAVATERDRRERPSASPQAAVAYASKARYSGNGIGCAKRRPRRSLLRYRYRGPAVRAPRLQARSELGVCGDAADDRDVPGGKHGRRRLRPLDEGPDDRTLVGGRQVGAPPLQLLRRESRTA